MQTHSLAIDFEMETFVPIQRVTGSYRNAALPKKCVIAFFSGSIPGGMNIENIKKQIKSGCIYIKAFPEAKPTQLNYQVLPKLEKYSYDAAIINVRINDKLRSKNSNDLNGLPENIIKVGKICQNHNIGKIFISGIIPSTLTNVDICDINKKRLLCNKIILSLFNIHR